MGKLIFLIIIIAGIYYFFTKTKKDFPKENTKNSEDNTDLIMCDKCKTFTPKNEIKQINGQNICKECYDNSK